MKPVRIVELGPVKGRRKHAFVENLLYYRTWDEHQLNHDFGRDDLDLGEEPGEHIPACFTETSGFERYMCSVALVYRRAGLILVFFPVCVPDTIGGAAPYLQLVQENCTAPPRLFFSTTDCDPDAERVVSVY
jgi:hypothetical protein